MLTIGNPLPPYPLMEMEIKEEGPGEDRGEEGGEPERRYQGRPRKPIGKRGGVVLLVGVGVAWRICPTFAQYSSVVFCL